MRRILLIEDEPILRELMTCLLRDLDCHVLHASSQTELERLSAEPFDAAVVDLSVLKPMPEMLVQRLKDNPEQPQVILCSASTSLLELAKHMGCMSLAKPFSIDDFSEVVGGALEIRARRQDRLIGWGLGQNLAAHYSRSWE